MYVYTQLFDIVKLVKPILSLPQILYLNSYLLFYFQLLYNLVFYYIVYLFLIFNYTAKNNTINFVFF